MKYIALILFAVSLTGCVTFDKDRATEQRKQELCRDIETRNLPQCAGSYVPPSPTT